MKRLIISALIVIAIVYAPLITMAQDDWGPAAGIDFNPENCDNQALYGYSILTIGSNDSLMFVKSTGETNIYYSTFTDNEWQCPVPLPYYIQNMDVGTLFLYDAVDTIIYFSSAMDGGYGGSDIWAARPNLSNSEWSDPWNLGPEINSSESESSPSMTRDGTKLFFLRNSVIMASDVINGEFTTPAVLPDIINDPDNRNPIPQISPDGLRLYFSEGGAPYVPAPMVVCNFVNGLWQAPIHLNGNINFSSPDPYCDLHIGQSFSPSFSLNGEKMYFTHFEAYGQWCEPANFVCVSDLITGIENENPLTPSSISLSAYPNPFNAQTRIVYAGDISELKDIAIYSITGQKVKSFAPAAEILWDGTDVRGNEAASGLYFVVANGTNHRVTSKVTLLR